MTTDILAEPARLIHDGKKVEAREWLIAFVEQNPEHEKAWLWLAALMPGLDDRIIALENAYTLKPRRATAVRLETLRERQSQRTINGWQIDPYHEAVTTFRNGKRREAQLMLTRIVEDDPAHLQAWWGLGQIARTRPEQIAALQRVLAIDPAHVAGRERLLTLLEAEGELEQLALFFEQRGDLPRALDYYRQLQQIAAGGEEKKRRREKVRELKKQMKQRKQKEIKLTGQTATWVRLAVGPVLLFALLALLQSGLHPLRWLAWMLTAGLVTATGSVMMIGAFTVPEHPVWTRYLGETAVPRSRKLKQIAFLGLVLTWTPFIFLLITSLLRVDQYRQLLLSTGG